MSKIKGQNIICSVKQGNVWVTFAYGTTCELDVNAETVECGNPSSGVWPTVKVRRLRWTMSCGQLMSDNASAVHPFNLLTARQEIQIKFCTVSNHDAQILDPSAYSADGKVAFTGNAVITRYTATGKNKDYATSSVSFVGSGELTLTRS